MIGITSYGGYIPRLRLNRMSIFKAMGWFSPAIVTVAQGMYDPDTGTVRVGSSFEEREDLLLLSMVGQEGDEAVRRMAGERSVRPLLESPNPVRRARELLEVREGRYTMAHLTLDTEAAAPQDLALSVLDHIDLGK